MSKGKKLIPELRFPEFKNDGKWVENTLEEICEIIKGEQLNKIELTDTGKYPCQNGGINPSGYTDKFNSEANTITISEGGNSCGYVNFMRSKFWLGGHCYKLQILKDIDKIFLYQLLKFNEERLMKLRVGSGLPNIQQKELRNFKLVVSASSYEQQKIASCLSSLDEVIAAHSQKLKLLKEHKKGLLQNLFPREGEKVPKYRFPEFEKDGKWMNTKLEGYIDLVSGIALKSEELSDDEAGVPILRGINITEGYIRHSRDIDKYFTGDIEPLKKYLIRENDIVIGMDGSKVGKNVALIKKEDENSILIQRIARIRPVKKTDIRYVYQHFLSDKFRVYVDTVNTSSGIPHISAQQIKDFTAGFPPTLKEQQKIASCLSSLDELISEQTNKIEQLKLHKKGLIQGLFPNITG